MCKYIVILLSMLHKLPRAHSEPFGIIPHFNSANSCSIFEQNTFFNFIHASFIGVFLTKKNYKNCLKWPYCKERWKCHWPVLNVSGAFFSLFQIVLQGRVFCIIMWSSIYKHNKIVVKDRIYNLTKIFLKFKHIVSHQTSYTYIAPECTLFYMI